MFSVIELAVHNAQKVTVFTRHVALASLLRHQLQATYRPEDLELAELYSYMPTTS
jgi:hypothetical protein